MHLHSLNPKDGHVEGARARFLGRALSISFATGLLLVGAIGHMPTASAADSLTCSNRSLRGNYGSAIDGTIFLPSPAPSLLVRGVALQQFDGHGSFSQVDFVTLNGASASNDWRPGTGTYEINSDCTGTMEINFDDGSPSLHLRLIVVDGGRQLMTVVEGNATGSLGTRVR
jgi:hypothetical protein